MSSAVTGTSDRSVLPGNRVGNLDAVSWNARTYLLWMSAILSLRKRERIAALPVQGSNIGWTITVTPDSAAAVTVVLPVTTDCGADGTASPSARRTAGSCPTGTSSPFPARPNRTGRQRTRRRRLSPLAGRGAGSESCSEASGQQKGPDCGHAEAASAAPGQRGSPCPRSRRRRSWCSTNTSGGARLGRKQGR